MRNDAFLLTTARFVNRTEIGPDALGCQSSFYLISMWERRACTKRPTNSTCHGHRHRHRRPALLNYPSSAHLPVRPLDVRRGEEDAMHAGLSTWSPMRAGNSITRSVAGCCRVLSRRKHREKRRDAKTSVAEGIVVVGRGERGWWNYSTFGELKPGTMCDGRRHTLRCCAVLG